MVSCSCLVGLHSFVHSEVCFMNEWKKKSASKRANKQMRAWRDE